jgi:uracil phosphoribosyltransferase
MRVQVVEHPLIAHKLSVLRDAQTPSSVFRHMVHDLTVLVAAEATRDLPLDAHEVVTPVATMTGQSIASPTPVAVPILRAGLGMLDGFLELVPTADSGFLGLKRNEKTLVPEVYAKRFPTQTTGRHIFLLDPMLATGGSLIASIDIALAEGASEITCVCLVASPQGVEAVTAACTDKPVSLFLAVIDEKLNDSGYIVPGLGDAGDRMFGVA